MKLKWTSRGCNLHGVGIVETGKVYEFTDSLAARFQADGRAVTLTEPVPAPAPVVEEQPAPHQPKRRTKKDHNQ